MLRQIAAAAYHIRRAFARVDGLPKPSLYDLGPPICAFAQFIENGLASTATGEAVATLPSPPFNYCQLPLDDDGGFFIQLVGGKVRPAHTHFGCFLAI